MQYAESLLLCGQLIDANEVGSYTYRELICRCPSSKKEVFLVDSHKSVDEWGNICNLANAWKHSQTVTKLEAEMCERENILGNDQIEMKNFFAKQKQIELLSPNLLELIKSSAILDQPVSLEDCSNFWSDNLLRWFGEKIEATIVDKKFQDRLAYECQNLYTNCVKQTLAQNKNGIADRISENFTSYNHLVYGVQVACEMLKYALANFDPENRKILIYLGLNDVTQEAMSICVAAILMCTEDLLKGNDKSNFQQLWKENNYQGMNKILEIAREAPSLGKVFTKYFAGILHPLTINLCLVFWFVPWLDELKKLNQQTNPNKIC